MRQESRVWSKMGRLPLLLTAVLVAVVLVASVALAGCGGGDDEETTTTTTETTEDTGTETTEAESDGDMDTETTEAESGDDMDSTGDAEMGPDDAVTEFEIIDGLPDDFPDIELPDDTTLLQARAGEVPDGAGGTMQIVVAAFETAGEAQDQYEHFEGALEDAGYELLLNQSGEFDGTYMYSLVGTDQDVAVSVSGGEDTTEFDVDFPDAQHPFVIAVGPPGMF